MFSYVARAAPHSVVDGVELGEVLLKHRRSEVEVGGDVVPLAAALAVLDEQAEGDELGGDALGDRELPFVVE